MNKTRRVGILTLGISLMVFGIVFLLRIFIPTISYEFILRLWPSILIILGGEVLVSYFINKEENYKLDIASVIIIVCMGMFAAGMAVIEQFVLHYDMWIDRF